MRMRIQDLSGWLDLTYRRPKIDDLWSSSDDGSRVSQASAQVRTLLPPIFKQTVVRGTACTVVPSLCQAQLLTPWHVGPNGGRRPFSD